MTLPRIAFDASTEILRKFRRKFARTPQMICGKPTRRIREYCKVSCDMYHRWSLIGTLQKKKKKKEVDACGTCQSCLFRHFKTSNLRFLTFHGISMAAHVTAHDACVTSLNKFKTSHPSSHQSHRMSFLLASRHQRVP